MSPSSLPTATSYPSIVGGVLAKIRSQKGLRQEEMAQALGVTQTTLSRMETGQSIISVEHLRLVAHHLGIAPSQILSYADYNEVSLQNQGVEVMPTRGRPDIPPAMIFLAGAALATLLTLAVVSSQQS